MVKRLKRYKSMTFTGERFLNYKTFKV